MSDSTQLLALIKKASMDAVKASKPAEIVFGTVAKTNPLEIRVEQKLVLNQNQLILTRSVMDYTTTINYGEGDRQSSIKNGLKVGEKVVLLQMQGGQRFVVLDRVVAV